MRWLKRTGILFAHSSEVSKINMQSGPCSLTTFRGILPCLRLLRQHQQSLSCRHHSSLCLFNHLAFSLCVSVALFLYHQHWIWRRKWKPTPMFLPGESQGWGSLVGCHLWGHTELDTTEATQQQQQQQHWINAHPDDLILT